MTSGRAPAHPVLGVGANLPQFSLLVLVNAFVGGMVGIERSILPTLAEVEFGLAERTAILSFIAVFGVTKALSNYLAGRLGDRWGRKPVLVAGWLVDRCSRPVPPHVGTNLDLDRRRKCLPGREPRPDVVNGRDHEDRPGRPEEPWACDGPERVRRLFRGCHRRLGDRIHRIDLRPQARTILSRRRVRHRRAVAVHIHGP